MNCPGDAFLQPWGRECTFALELHKLLACTEPFAFVRFGDGEHALLTGRRHVGHGWVGPSSWLQPLLYAALVENLPGYVVGRSTGCCQPHCAKYYRQNIRAKNQTFATLFSYSNQDILLKSGLLDRALTVGSHDSATFKVPTNAVNDPWAWKNIAQEIAYADGPVLVAAGPLANVIIHEAWLHGPRRGQFIDIGSGYDAILHAKISRAYNNPNHRNYAHRCTWP